MPRNPYTPPDSSEIAFLKEVAPPRPIAVWLLIVILGAMGVVVMLGGARFVVIVASHRDQISSGVALVVALAWRLAVLGAFALVIGGVYQRRAWGRWIGLLIPVGMAAFSMFGTDSTVYNNEAERNGGFLAREVFIPALFAWWAYALGFSRKAKRYYAKQASSEGQG